MPVPDARRIPAYYQNWGSDPLFSFAPPPTPMPFGMSPQDLAGMGPVGAALQMGAPLVSEWARTRFGAFGFTFGSGINPAATEYGREFLQQMQAGRAAGAQADQGALNDLLRGLAVIIGHRPDLAATRAAGDGRVRFDQAGERMISRMAADGSAMLPFLAAMMPDAVDAALPGGSRTVAAGYMTAANRFMVDPVTGERLSRDAGFVSRVLDPLIAKGPAATDGLRAGRVGALYAELSSRGLIGPGEDVRDQVARRDAFDTLTGVSRLDDRDAPGVNAPTARRVNAARVEERLAGYSKAIAAVNEIFAENGRANAPMAELIAGLEALTQGGMGVFGSDRLTQIVRSFQGAGQEFGLTQAGMMRLAGEAGARLQAVGAHRGLAAPAAIYAAAAGNAYGSRGYEVGPETGSTADQMTMTLARQTAFAGSEMGNLVGALDVQRRYLGGEGENTDLGRVVKALRGGQTTAVLNDGSTFDLRTADQAAITGLAERSGLSAQSMLNQIAFGRSGNQAALAATPGYAAVGRQVQQAMAERTFESMFGGQLDTALAGRTTRNEFFTAMYAEVNDPGVTTVDQALTRVGTRLGLDRNARATIGPLLDEIGTQWARSAGVADVSGLAGWRNASPQARARADAAAARGDAAGDRASALARLNPQGALAGAADAVARAGRLAADGGFVRPDGTLDWQRLIASGALGMVDQEQAMRALGQVGRGGRGGLGGEFGAAVGGAADAAARAAWDDRPFTPAGGREDDLGPGWRNRQAGGATAGFVGGVGGADAAGDRADWRFRRAGGAVGPVGGAPEDAGRLRQAGGATAGVREPGTPAGTPAGAAAAAPQVIRVTGEVIFLDNGVRRPGAITLVGEQAAPPGGR